MDKTINFTISFPTWFYGVLTIGTIIFLLYLGGLHAKLKEICANWPKVRQALGRISEILLQNQFAKEFIYSESPINLNDIGRSAITEARFEEFYNTNKDILLKRIKEVNPKTMADLEEVCKTIMLQIEETLPKFEFIKQYAYQHGEPISKILFACAIALRNIVAEELKLIQENKNKNSTEP